MSIFGKIHKVLGRRLEKERAFLSGCVRLRKWVWKGFTPIAFDYPVNPVPRYGHGKNVHQGLLQILNRRRDNYIELMGQFAGLRNDYSRIAVTESQAADDGQPYWKNTFVIGLDAVSLYCMPCINRSRQYIEIGSGNSTKFVRRAILDQQLETRITSIDPYPRAEIDQLCDRVIRKPFEDCDLSIFDDLQSGDIVMLDGSHRALMNSDVTVFFLDVLPKLKGGVFVYIDDIFIPQDYPDDWKEKYYSEQYLLSTLLLAEAPRYEIVLPCSFICNDDELSKAEDVVWNQMESARSSSNGFWLRIGSGV